MKYIDRTHTRNDGKSLPAVDKLVLIIFEALIHTLRLTAQNGPIRKRPRPSLCKSRTARLFLTTAARTVEL